jgi:uncharacterized protein YjlB
MVQIKTYHLAPTALIPNSPYPLVHYQELLPRSTPANDMATGFYDLLAANQWSPQWIFRYGRTQRSHYHSLTHECMIVLTGEATVRFGVADTDPDDMEANTFGGAAEPGGLELRASPGDVFVIPVGVAHKTFAAEPAAGFELLTPGDGHDFPPPAEARALLRDLPLDGFTMMGAYPSDSQGWDSAVGGEGAAVYAKVWSTPPPNLDPVLGNSPQGITKTWKDIPRLDSKL